MTKLKISNEWWTAPAQADDGNLIMVTGRRGLENVKATGAFKYRITITWSYKGGMPDEPTAKLMEEVNDALNECFDRDPVAVNTGIYTGDGSRNWVFYTRSLNIFQRKINEALNQFELLPLEFNAVEDPEWMEYAEMMEAEVASSD